MNTEEEFTPPYYYVAMPLNSDGTGPETDPAKVARVQHEIWNGLMLSIATVNSAALAEAMAAAMNAAMER